MKKRLKIKRIVRKKYARDEGDSCPRCSSPLTAHTAYGCPGFIPITIVVCSNCHWPTEEGPDA